MKNTRLLIGWGLKAVAALVLGASVLAPAVASAQAPGTQRATGERLARAGLTRVEDVFWFWNGWEAHSRNGYAVRPTATGMPGSPLLTADGQPFLEGAFGQSPWATLPLHLNQVETARASRAPQLVAGRLAPDGALRLSLQDPEPGFWVRGAFSGGNEVGDPGPFRSTERTVINVDRIGPQYLAEASLRGPRGASALASLRAVSDYTTERIIRTRVENVQDTLDGPPLQQLIAPRLSLRDGDLLPGTHHLTGHYTAFRALPLFKTLGYEVPARRREARVTAQGRVQQRSTPTSPRVRYRLGYGHTTFTSDPERFREEAPAFLDFDWQEEQVSGQVELARLPLGGASWVADGDARLRLGLSGDYTRVDARRAPLDDPDVLTTRAYAALSAPSFPLRPQLVGLFSQTDGHFGGGLLLSTHHTPTERSSAALDLGYVREPYAASASQWHWQTEGLPVPRTPDAQVALPAALPTSERLTADLRLRYAFAGGTYLELEGGARHFHSLALPDVEYRFVPLRLPTYTPPGGRLVPDLRLRTDAGGQTLYVSVGGAATLPAGLAHRLRYMLFTHYAAGAGSQQRAFDQRFQRVPRHRLRYTVRMAVGQRFSLEGRADARSAEHWPAYHAVAAAGSNAYRARLPARLRLDLAATKRFWGDRLRVRLAVRNLLDAPLRTHPVGPAKRLALFMSAEAQF